MKQAIFPVIISVSAILLAIIYSTTGSVELPVLAQNMDPVNPSIITKKEKKVAGHPVLKNISSEPGIVEVELTASPERLSLKPGSETNVYAYNGTIPGPMLEAFEGDSIIVHFKNNLSEETTVHWHGIHLPFIMDGSPFHPIAAGESFTYRFRLHEGTAGTYWYHPHPHHVTAWQVGKGLYGGIIVRDPNDPLPVSLTEHLLVLSDNKFDENGEIHFAEPGSRQKRIDDMNGREGDVMFVNDELMPNLSIRSGEVQRWRIVNASGARTYRLALKYHTFTLIGSDGGLFEYPEEVEEIVLGNGERAELLVRGTGKPGTEVTLQALPYDRYMPMWRPGDWDKTRELLKLSYTSESSIEEQFVVPESLRKIPILKIEDATETRIMRMSNGKINSKIMDMKRVDETAYLGATEIWDIRNLVGMDHPFHIHGFQFQVIDRNGIPVKQRKWKDVVNVPGFEKARFIIKYKNYTGKWMYHCHILDHEDQGMMGVLEVK
jgi:bilirubin oxidase